MQVEFCRPASLHGLVHGIWEQRSPTPQTWRILPSGHAELIFRIGPPFSLLRARRLGPEDAAPRAFCFLSGLHTRPLDMAFDALHVVGAQLSPAAVQMLFGMPCDEVLDGAIDGRLLLNDLARIEDRLLMAPDFPSRAAVIEDELRVRLSRAGDLAMAQRMAGLVARLRRGTRMTERGLCAALGYSRSHAHRLCRAWLGQPATECVRLSRFAGAVAALHDETASLTAVGHARGYYDQAHFIREFRQYAGMTPGAYRRGRSALPGQLQLPEARVVRA